MVGLLPSVSFQCNSLRFPPTFSSIYGTQTRELRVQLIGSVMSYWGSSFGLRSEMPLCELPVRSNWVKHQSEQRKFRKKKFSIHYIIFKSLWWILVLHVGILISGDVCFEPQRRLYHWSFLAAKGCEENKKQNHKPNWHWVKLHNVLKWRPYS